VIPSVRVERRTQGAAQGGCKRRDGLRGNWKRKAPATQQSPGAGSGDTQECAIKPKTERILPGNALACRGLRHPTNPPSSTVTAPDTDGQLLTDRSIGVDN
jgi:hypothetical protein